MDISEEEKQGRFTISLAKIDFEEAGRFMSNIALKNNETKVDNIQV